MILIHTLFYSAGRKMKWSTLLALWFHTTENNDNSTTNQCRFVPFESTIVVLTERNNLQFTAVILLCTKRLSLCIRLKRSKLLFNWLGVFYHNFYFNSHSLKFDITVHCAKHPTVFCYVPSCDINHVYWMYLVSMQLILVYIDRMIPHAKYN